MTPCDECKSRDGGYCMSTFPCPVMKKHMEDVGIREGGYLSRKMKEEMMPPKGHCDHDSLFDHSHSHCHHFEKELEFIGRPKRETIISKDDELNLKIALETAKTEEEFLSLV